MGKMETVARDSGWLMTPRTTVRLAALLCLLLTPAALADQAKRLSLEEYSELISRYQRGDFSGVASTLSQLPRQSFQDAAKDYERQPLSDHQRMVAQCLTEPF